MTERVKKRSLTLLGRMLLDVSPSIGIAEASAWMMFVRLGLVYGVLCLLILQQVLRPEAAPNWSVQLGYALLAIGFAANLLFALVPKPWSEHALMAGAQIAFDSVLVSIWLYHCNEDSNPWVLFYLVQILAVSLLLYRSGSVFVAFTSVLSFGMVIWLREWSYSTWAAYSGLFMTIGLVGGYLSEELRRASESLKEKNKKIDQLVAFQERILADIPTGLLTVDGQNVVRFLNPAAELILACRENSVIGRQLESVLPSLLPFFSKIEDEGSLDAALDVSKTGAGIAVMGESGLSVKSKSHRGAVRLQQRVDLGDGVQAKILRGDVAELLPSDESQALLGSHAAIGRVLLFQDVTKISHLEEKLRQHEKLAAVGQLAAGIAHEIRNPLASMSASIEMLKSTLSPSNYDVENQKLMDIAIREIDRLNRLVSEFLDYVKPEKFQFEKVPLSELLGEIVMGTRQALERGTIRPAKTDQRVPKIEVVEEYSNDAIALGNSEKLRQVILNLIVNAVQAMHQAGNVRVGCAGRDDQSVCFWIEDQGQGMSEKTLAHLYEPFFTTKDKGTGLGLATAYKIVEAHQGEINVRSRLGQGTRFEVVLQRG